MVFDLYLWQWCSCSGCLAIETGIMGSEGGEGPRTMSNRYHFRIRPYLLHR